MKKLKALLTVAVLIALIFTAVSCGKTASDTQTTTAETTAGTTAAASGEAIELGTGSKHFGLKVVDASGEVSSFIIGTDESTVGEALQKLGLIEGEEGDYGLYIKSVNGITADYDKDRTYWAFYINGEYATTSADLTEITENTEYMLKVEK